MINSAEKFAETTDISEESSVIDDALLALRIRGSCLLRETYATPWAIAIPDGKGLAQLLGLKQEASVIAFHLIEFGHCELRPEGHAPLSLRAGELAICFGGTAHRIAAGRSAGTQAIAGLLSGQPNRRRPQAQEESATTMLLCGVFLLQHTALNPLLGAVPSVLLANLSRAGELHNLSGVARLLAEEIDRRGTRGGYVAERLLEVLCAQAIRAHAEAPERAGWFRGLKDPVVGRAIAAIHANPGRDWSVALLAQRVSMSPSRFAARFSEATGESPMAYATKWRMNLACRRIDASRAGIEQIAAEVGYESVAAFNRAFKRHLGVPPAAWRERAKAV
jgi:AraC-like DNA-binding protein